MALELERHRRPVGVLRLELHLRGALDGDAHRPEREAALRVGLRVVSERRDDRVHEQAVLAVERADEEAAEDPDLGRREPDALGVVHEGDHPLAHLVELVVELTDLVGAHPQDGVAVLADL